MRILYSKIPVIVYCAIILLSCSEKEISHAALIEYVQDESNGLIKKNEVNGIVTEVTYKPTDMWVQLEVGDEPVRSEVLDSLRNHYGKYYYFILNLSKNNKEALHSAPGSSGEYSDLVQTLSFRMSEFVTLTTEKQDTIPVGDFILDRTYGLSSSTAVLFVFANDEAKKTDWIQFNLNEFGLGTGNQRFRFKTEELENIPMIHFTLIP